ncbi:ATP-binding cassette domain-containing protein [Microbacterium excoecariae]|uniref:ATP-binding cassette domain-containing protein n=1 Tax=Microbacterium excoecariae TaxID=2715210 RepID=UPI001407CADC|nr:ABC transporter ATP-binding protein [Microbacterium excoecariae]
MVITSGKKRNDASGDRTGPPRPGESARDAARRLAAEDAARTAGAAPHAPDRESEVVPDDAVVSPDTPVPDAALQLRGLVKTYGGEPAVAGIDLTVPTGSFYGLVGPNGAGKTTTLSMISGLIRPDKGEVSVFGVDAVGRSREAKRLMGVLPDRMRTFDRLTGRQLLHYTGALRGLDAATARARADDLAASFDLGPAMGRAVSDYSTGMTKKILLACAMIHAPRLLVLDEPFESVDPVSAARLMGVLRGYVDGGGTVILSGHSMSLIETVCSRIAVLVTGQVLAEGTVDEVRGEMTLEQRFVDLSGAGAEGGALEWLHTSSS